MKPKTFKNNQATPVAIIGIGAIFPCSPSLKGYWRLLLNGRDAIGDVPESHWSAADYFNPDPKAPDRVYCTRGGFLSAVSFDPTEFGLPPAILEATDTSQLLGLVAARMALDDAGYGKDAVFDRSRTSVILGVTGTQELVIPLGARLGHPKWRRALEEAGVSAEKTEAVIEKIAASYVSWQENSFPGLLGNVVAGRICNRLDLGGTNCVVDAACASSMSAFHLALMELSAGRSDMVLSGGVDTLNDIFMHMCFSRTGVLSRTGDARPFSAEADGTVLGEGIGICALKRLDEARRDGDRIYAVIRGMGSASDGRSQSIYAPRFEGQAAALERAYENAGVDPRTVALLEAHGTGTRVGDGVEFAALRQVLDPDGDGAPCALGSVKSMIGHTKAAAGAAGMIKAALALHHKVLPPSLKAGKIDPNLQIDKSRFFVADRAMPWIGTGLHPRRAGVSAFGFGGSNFHAVLEEAGPEKEQPAWDGASEIVAFSGADPETVKQAVAAFCDRIAADQATAANLALATANLRKRFSASAPWRLLAVFDPEKDAAALTEKLRSAADRLTEDPVFSAREGIFAAGPQAPGGLAVLFPGQGSQYPDMGRGLVCTFPEAFGVVSRFSQNGSRRLSDLIYPVSGQRQAAERLRATDVAQPAIGAVSLAMWRVLERFSVSPDAFAGHSFGELTALCAAGRIDEGHFAALSRIRGRLMAAAAGGRGGTMLAVKAPLERIEALAAQYAPELVLANRNAPAQGVLSGTEEAVAEAEKKCRKQGWPTVRLAVSAAFHSPLVTDAAAPFARALDDVPFLPGKVPVYGNTFASPYPEDPEEARRLLGGQLARPVDFSGEIDALYEAGCRVFLEVGPGRVLSGLVNASLAGKPAVAFALDESSGKERSGTEDLARTLCRLSALGISVNLDRWETSPEETRIPGMQVMLTGANLRPVEQRKPAPFPTEKNAAARTEDLPPVSSETAISRTRTASTRNDHRQTAKTMSNPVPQKSKRPAASGISDAFRVVEEGIRSMQALQEQTARAHEKFLDIQAEAARNLQRLMEGARSLAEGGPEKRPPVYPQPGQAGIETAGAAAQPLEPAPAPPAAAAQTDPSPESEPFEKPDGARSAVVETLVSVVSELTGYPAEMIGADMDIEADLGIDSIKRVEILSTVEERMPGLPRVTPDMMGSLRTLAQIAAFLSGGQQEQAPGEKPDPGFDEVAPGPAPDSDLSEEIARTLVSVVSELTGYPAEMIGADMDIEADLGIDSIKRVEILSTVEERMPGLPRVTPDMMGSLRTLAQIAAFLSGGQQEQAPGEPPPSDRDAAGPPPEPEPAADRPLLRRKVSMVERPRRPSEVPVVPEGRAVYITKDEAGFSSALAAAFARAGVSSKEVSLEGPPPDFSDAAGLVIVADAGSSDGRSMLKNALLFASEAGSALLSSAAAGFALFGAVVRLDGAFGFSGAASFDPFAAGLSGLVKCAAVEWPEVSCRVLDINPSWQDLDAAAQEAAAELLSGERDTEVGLCVQGRSVPELLQASFADGTPETPDFSEDDVVLVTGGARGVTAEAAEALARCGRPTLILLGRSPAPSDEPGWLRGLKTENEIKKGLLENAFSGGSPSPARLESAYRQIASAREVASSLARIEKTGARVRYFSADVREASMLESILEEVRAFYGPVTAVVHGAGVLEDRLIVEKTGEQFDRVFSTKVDGLQAVLDATRKEPLRAIVLFSSVAARFGNRGQADYAMANEVLNKIARIEAASRPDCRVRAINWGPWDGGMVSPALRREFHRRGVDLIPLAAGARALLRELASPDPEPVEVVIGASLAPERKESAAPPDPDGLCLTLRRELDVEGFPVLASHVLDGKPVVPFALMADWLGHGALKENPGLTLFGLDDIRVLKGIRLDAEKRLVRLMAGKAIPDGELFKADVEIRDGVQEGHEVVHYRAKAVLCNHPFKAPDFAPPTFDDEAPYGRSAEDLYREVLFHGRHLQGIRRIIAFSEKGMRAALSSAPDPTQWIQKPPFDRWSLDPLVLDSAFQMSIVWSFERFGQPSLPSYAASYRQYRQRFPQSGVTAVMEIREHSLSRIKGDFSFIDEDGGLIARLTGYEAVMDPGLIRSFRPEPAVSQGR